MSTEHGIGGDPEEALRLAEEVIHAAEPAGAGEAEALVVAGESALTRFANSEIHQNVASAEAFVNLRFVERPPGRRRVVGPGRRRGHPRARRARRGDRRERRGARGLGGPAVRRSAADAPRRLVRAHRPRQPRAARRGRPRGHRRGRRGRRHGLRVVLDRGRGHRGRQHQGHPRRRAPHDLAAADGDDGPRQRDRLRGAVRRRRDRRSTPPRSAARPPSARRRARTRSTSSPATIRSCSTSTRSSTSSTCSATSASRRSRSRRTARSSSAASRSPRRW